MLWWKKNPQKGIGYRQITFCIFSLLSLKQLFIVIWDSGFDVFILCFLFQVSNRDSMFDNTHVLLVSSRKLRENDVKTISISNDGVSSFINRNYLTIKCVFCCSFFILAFQSIWVMLCFLRGSNKVNPIVNHPCFCKAFWSFPYKSPKVSRG